jgi:SH3-like domain-containing protein
MAEPLTTKPWALAALSVSNLRAIPDHASELVSQAMMGTPLKVIDFRDKFYQVQTPEGYMGWLDAKGLEVLTEEEHESWKRSNRFFYNKISGYAYESPQDQNDVVSDLVLGDLIVVEEEGSLCLKIKLPDGRTGFVPVNECISFED